MQESQETWLLWTGKIPWRRACTPPSILAWRIPWTEEPGGLRSMGSHRAAHDWAWGRTELHTTEWRSMHARAKTDLSYLKCNFWMLPFAFHVSPSFPHSKPNEKQRKKIRLKEICVVLTIKSQSGKKRFNRCINGIAKETVSYEES